jgi:hypothetical protein
MLKVYKYISPNIISVLQNCMIRYTQPGALNDPFEISLTPWFSSLLPENMHPEIGRIFHRELAKQVEKKRQTILVLCLTERNDNHLMWAHYASNSQGFLIGFNSEHPYFDERKSPSDQFRHLRKVQYRTIRPVQAKAFSLMDVYLTKGMDWEYEQEWRIFRSPENAAKVENPDAPYPIYLFKFPPAAVVEVILGSNMSEDNRKAITCIITNSSHFHHVNLLQAYLSDKDYQIRFKKITP